MSDHQILVEIIKVLLGLYALLFVLGYIVAYLTRPDDIRVLNDD